MNLHVFVAMPFGTKEKINFNKVYEDYIKPALEAEGFEVFRADEERRAGEIRTDMFQELLLADLVVVDLSIDNPNVWYELGVRHALRSRGVIQIKSTRDYMPFDVYTDRTLSYHIKDGVPDSAMLDEDKKALASFAVETCKSWHKYRISPVYHLLTYLQEPDWKSLYIKEAGEYWQQQKQWEQRIEVARKKQRAGDILVLSEEAPNYPLLHEAHFAAGKALLKLGQYSFALERFEAVLQLTPDDTEALQFKGIALGRQNKHPMAKEIFKSLVTKTPDDAETLALLGRVEKDAWIFTWRTVGATPEEMRKNAADEDGILREAIESYRAGFLADPSNYYPGINALTLHHILMHLTAPEEGRDSFREMEGGVRWAIKSALSKEKAEKKDYWARVSLAELELLVSDTPVVERAYKDAVAIADGNWFDLDSSRQQLMLLKDLDFRPVQVDAALAIVNRSLERLNEPWQPRKVFLFSGHMIDAPSRVEPRFPADKESIATTAIAAKLDEQGANDKDLALCGGACGGDLIFAEECLKRGLHLQMRIPFEEPEFLDNSVNFAGGSWRERYNAVKGHKNCTLFVMPEELGFTPKTGNPYERNNRWLLYSALSCGSVKIRFIALWDCKPGDGQGGTQHMYETVKIRSGETSIIDTNTLW
jgi:tetratricopeptide (TPR) repeat protein